MRGVAVVTAADIDYRFRTASERDIRLHLERCANDFVPPLQERVDIEAYARKLSAHSVTFEAWSSSVLAGLIAAYFNNVDSRAGFITSVSVLPDFAGQGIARRLVQACIAHARQEGFHALRLEVGTANRRAIGLYRGAGFADGEERNGLVTMLLSL